MNRDLHDVSLIILSAGSSTRFGGYKQFAQVGPNKEMIWEYSLFEAYKLGIKTVVFVIRKELKEDFLRIIKKKLPTDLEIHFAYQEIPKEFRELRSKPLGTGHALVASLPYIRKSNLLVNGDDYYDPQAFKMAHKILSDKQEQKLPAILSFPLNSTLSNIGSVSRAIIKSENGLVMDMEEYENIHSEQGKIVGMGNTSGFKELRPDSPVSMNLWLINRKVIKAIERDFYRFLQGMENPTSGEFQLPDSVWNYCIKENEPLFCIPSGEKWCGLTHAADLYGVQDYLSGLHNSGIYPPQLWK